MLDIYFICLFNKPRIKLFRLERISRLLQFFAMSKSQHIFRHVNMYINFSPCQNLNIFFYDVKQFSPY